MFAESYKIYLKISNKPSLFKTRTCSMNTGPVRCHLNIEYAPVQYGFGTLPLIIDDYRMSLSSAVAANRGVVFIGLSGLNIF